MNKKKKVEWSTRKSHYFRILSSREWNPHSRTQRGNKKVAYLGNIAAGRIELAASYPPRRIILISRAKIIFQGSCSGIKYIYIYKRYQESWFFIRRAWKSKSLSPKILGKLLIYSGLKRKIVYFTCDPCMRN